jgi:multiple sugar transport system permease protein
MRIIPSLVRPAYLFLAPAMLILGLFFFLPILASLLLSLTDFDIYALADSGNARWVGWSNYSRLLHEPLFWKALTNTLYFVCVGGPLSVVVSLSAALLVSSKLARFQPLWRTIFFAPVVTTLVAVAVVWRYLYHTRYGAFNYVLAWLGVGPIDWLGDRRWAMFAIILLAVWKNFGYNMVIFLAGLQSIPDELFEAARIDGAGTWHTFWKIKLPLLAPTFFFVGVTTMIGYFQLFAEPYVMTQGGPLESTYSLVMFMYEEGFRFWRIGFASAIAFLLFVIILAATAVQVRLQRGAQA